MSPLAACQTSMLRSLRPVCVTRQQKSMRYLPAGAMAGPAVAVGILVLSGTIIQLDVLHQVTAGAGMAQKKHQKRSLFESERRFRLLVEGIIDYAIYMLDPTGV